MDTQPHRYEAFDPAVVRDLGRLDWIARSLVHGFRQGLHRSVQKGVSTEFSEFRPYTRGDDFRLLDWRLYARTQKTYVRCYEAETNLQCTLALDATESMAWRWADCVSKLEYATNLMAALAYLMVSQQDTVGFLSRDAAGIHYLPPRASRSQLGRIYAWLGAARPGVGPAMPELLHALTCRRRHRGRIVLCSDLEEDAERLSAGLPELVSNRDDVLVIHLLDQAEVQLPFANDTTHLIDSETGERLRVNLAELRQVQAGRVARFRADWDERLTSWGVRYVPLDTGTNYLEALVRVLDERHG